MAQVLIISQIRDKFEDDDAYLTFLSDNAEKIFLLGSEFVLKNIDYRNIEAYKKIEEGIAKAYTYSSFGMILFSDAITVEIEDVLVNIGSPSEEEILIATFCNAIANNLEYTVNDRSTEISLLYIDDLINEMLYALEGKEHHCDYPAYPSMSGERYSPFENKNGRYCYVPAEHKATLGYIVDLLESFATQPNTLLFDSIPEGSFAKKLYSTYLSYLPAAKTIFSLAGTTDNRGSFTEFFRNKDVGQFSINVSKPGMTKGQHWHHTKMEIFLVVSGHGLIQERQIGINPETGKEYPVREFEVSGSKLQCVYMLPGYTHNIINLSDTDDMVTVMWANEIFDPEHPETYHERV